MKLCTCATLRTKIVDVVFFYHANEHGSQLADGRTR